MSFKISNNLFRTFSKNPYKILDIAKGASDAEIKKAYFKLAKLHHPDVTNGNDVKVYSGNV